jgi:hypothetical protein
MARRDDREYRRNIEREATQLTGIDRPPNAVRLSHGLLSLY